MKSYLIDLSCRECGARYPAEARSTCADCFGPLDPTYDFEAIRVEVTRTAIEAGPRSRVLACLISVEGWRPDAVAAGCDGDRFRPAL